MEGARWGGIEESLSEEGQLGTGAEKILRGPDCVCIEARGLTAASLSHRS